MPQLNIQCFPDSLSQPLPHHCLPPTTPSSSLEDEGKQEIPRRLEGSCPWAVFLLLAGLASSLSLSPLGPGPRAGHQRPEGLWSNFSTLGTCQPLIHLPTT